MHSMVTDSLTIFRELLIDSKKQSPSLSEILNWNKVKRILFVTMVKNNVSITVVHGDVHYALFILVKALVINFPAWLEQLV